MKKLAILFFLAVLVYACSGDKPAKSSSSTPKPTPQKVDDGKGVGPVKNVKINTPLDARMVASGKSVYEMKCSACHKLTDKRVVGPGWKGLTDKRQPEWIMNMTMNVEEMLKEDDEAKKLLKECLVRMPNQNLSKDDARNVLEFIFANDGKEVGK